MLHQHVTLAMGTHNKPVYLVVVGLCLNVTTESTPVAEVCLTSPTVPCAGVELEELILFAKDLNHYTHNRYK